MKKLPIGLADFSEIISGDYIYADKTKLLYELLKERKPYFLSRPRRFGKTLLVSALEAILKGRRELFKGLWIDDSDYDWQPKPVIRLSLNGLDSSSLESLEEGLLNSLSFIAESESLTLRGLVSPVNAFTSLIVDISTKYQLPVSVLIDEYDAPILEQMNTPALAEAIRAKLHSFYNCLKSSKDTLGFTFITGVAKFAKVSLFSSLNHLIDLTLDKDYADICGFTLPEFDALFADHLENSLKSLKEDGF
ncbi:MAG: AAA family ATPase, partial [Deltaproteobacteria bacterium]|nr:AAA family ATPase [Deltaproteobacteria bacterium]